MSQIDRTPEALQKEHRIEELELAIKKKRTAIKSLRTRLEKTKDAIKDMVRKSSSVMSSVMERTIAIQEELTRLLKELLGREKILKKKAHRKAVEDMLEGFQLPMSDEFQEFSDQWKQSQDGYRETEAGEEEDRPQNPFTEFRQEPDKEEKRDIRKLYLKLSQVFHPDMATNEEENKRNHEMMKRITQAYESHDVHALLEIERRYQEENFQELEDPNASNLLDAKIERLERELAFLENQATRLSVELKQIRKSESGQALTDFDRNERDGFGLDEQQSEMDLAMAPFEELKIILEDALAKNKMTDPLKTELTPAPAESMEGMLGMLSELLQGEEGDFFGGWDDDEFQEGPSRPPKFEEGDIVAIKTNKFKQRDGLNKGAIGLVTDISVVEDSYEYLLLLEESAIKGLSATTVEYWLEDYFDLPLLEVMESDLQAVKNGFVDPFASISAGRKMMYERLVQQEDFHLSDAQTKRLLEIVLREPGKSDKENWIRISDFHRLPKNTKVRIADNDLPHLMGVKTATFIRIEEFDEGGGFHALIRKGNGRTLCPLHLLRFSHVPASLQDIMEIYRVWGEFRLPILVNEFMYFDL